MTGAMTSTSLETGASVRCERLRKVYPSPVDDTEVVALDDVDLSVHPGESVALLGPSGAGKSTLMMLLAGLQRPTSGQLFVGPDDTTLMTERELLSLRKHRVGVVVQNPGRNLIPYATAVDNVRFAQRGVRKYRRRELPLPTELLDRLGLSALAMRVVGSMSGGEQQRLAVAVGMACSPGLLLADEPTSQLDARSREAVIALLQSVAAGFGTTVVAVTHDPDVAVALGRTITIEDGRAHSGVQQREQYARVRPDGLIELPDDVRSAVQAAGAVRVVRKPDGVDLRWESR